MICKLTGQGTPRVGGWLESLEIVETAVRDSAFLNPAGKPQRVPERQDKLGRFPGKFSADCPSLRSRPAASLRCAPNSSSTLLEKELR